MMIRLARKGCLPIIRMPTARFSERLAETEERKKEKLINNMQSTESPRYWLTSARPADFREPLEVPTKPDNWYDKNRMWNEEDNDYRTRRTKLNCMKLFRDGCFALVGILGLRYLYERHLRKKYYHVIDTYEEFDISNLVPGQVVRTTYLGEPIFIRVLTYKEVEETTKLDATTQYDTKSYVATTAKDNYQLLVVSAKTDKGTIPEPYQGEYGGWFCPITGQTFDKFGRIRKGGAKGKNLRYLNNTLHGNILCLEQKMDYYSNYSLYLI